MLFAKYLSHDHIHVVSTTQIDHCIYGVDY